ncbi:FecR domain-containing protein [Porticoccaceae bacterium LTM1]|nr:FecR domain-containing protein [Porticoccaceae bacterium LTM1]
MDISKWKNIEQLASADVARMFSGELDDNKVERILKDRSRSVEYEALFLEILYADDAIDELADDPFLLSLVEKDNKKSELSVGAGSGQPGSAHWGAWPWLLAAACLVIVVSFVLYPLGTSIDDGSISRYVTRTGEQKVVTLPDGSVVTMNTGTQLLVDMEEGNERLVILGRGEAYFDVAADPDRPFSVKLDGRVVTVLGTEFNLSKQADGFTLAVVEGVVTVHRENEPASASALDAIAEIGQEVLVKESAQRRFKAGMAARFSVEHQSLTAFRPVDMARLIDWKSGVLRFENVPFNEVIMELNRYSAKKILIQDSSLMDLNVFASINIDDISGGLSALEQALPIKVVHQFDRIHIVSPKNSK